MNGKKKGDQKKRKGDKNILPIAAVELSTEAARMHSSPMYSPLIKQVGNPKKQTSHQRSSGISLKNCPHPIKYRQLLLR
ncbi:MAG: hypothetical protein WDN26_11415 [Chitinophagaceae bacterium]